MGKNSQAGGRLLWLTGLLAVCLGGSISGFSLPGKTLPATRLAAGNFYASPVAEPFNQTFKVDGQQRTALVYGSSAAVPKSGAPLVFAFHGHGGNSQFSARKFLIHRAWPEAVVIYPQGLPTPGKFDPEGRKNGWQKRLGDMADRDLKFFDAMLEWARRQYQIDSRRIYAMGHSNGGAMTYVLWSARANLIAAFAPCAAGFGRDALTAMARPAIILAGEQDEVVPFESQKRSLNFVLRLNQCETTGKAQGKALTFYPSKVGADVLAYLYPGAHPLPDDAGEVIVKFFRQYSLK
jgi:polyhydroxybutyrate depolymerase